MLYIFKDYIAIMTITERIHHIRQLIHQSEIASGYQQGQVCLLAVSKGHSSHDIEQAFAAGLTDFGESYLQEALPKIQILAALPLCWHFIGPIQSNKTQGIARHFSWVHSVSRLKIAQQLNDARPEPLPPLNICLQVNLDHEDTKSGVTPEEIADLAIFASTLPRLCLRGLMLIPKQQNDEEQQFLSFLRLTHLLNQLNHELKLSMDTLSMGMSHDFQAAIRAGSTIVRIGTAIFGERK